MSINKRYFKMFAKREGDYFWFWVRIFGYGISFRNTDLLFSERYGYKKVWVVKGVKIALLHREKA
ncbi:MAG: hypothetical protein V3R67_08860 [Thermodesulfobacteriota bacterium]